jgi:hypothetical protein
MLGWFWSGLLAQNNTVAGGGDHAGTGGSVSYSIGQIEYTTLVGAGGTMTQGLQQPYEILVVTGQDVADIDVSMAVYPNPATDYVMLQTDVLDWEELHYKLFDMQGKLLDQQVLHDRSTKIMMAQYSRGMYLLKVMKSRQEVKAFKIIKNQ